MNTAAAARVKAKALVKKIKKNPAAQNENAQLLLQSEALRVKNRATLILTKRIIPPAHMVGKLVDWALKKITRPTHGKDSQKNGLDVLMFLHARKQFRNYHYRKLAKRSDSRKLSKWLVSIGKTYDDGSLRAARPPYSRAVPPKPSKILLEVPDRCGSYEISMHLFTDYTTPSEFANLVSNTEFGGDLAGEKKCQDLIGRYTYYKMSKKASAKRNNLFLVLKGKAAGQNSPELQTVGVSLCTLGKHDVHIESVCTTAKCTGAGKYILRSIDNIARYNNKRYVTLDSLPEAETFYLGQGYFIGDPLKPGKISTYLLANGSVGISKSTRTSYRSRNTLHAGYDGWLPMYKDVTRAPLKKM